MTQSLFIISVPCWSGDNLIYGGKIKPGEMLTWAGPDLHQLLHNLPVMPHNEKVYNFSRLIINKFQKQPLLRKRL